MSNRFLGKTEILNYSNPFSNPPPWRIGRDLEISVLFTSSCKCRGIFETSGPVIVLDQKAFGFLPYWHWLKRLLVEWQVDLTRVTGLPDE